MPLADLHLCALYRGRQEAAEELLAPAIADEVGLQPDDLAPQTLAAALVTSRLALGQRYAETGESGLAAFERTLPMLRAALNALRDPS